MDTFERVAKELADFKEKEAEIAKTSPDRLIRIERLRRSPDQVKIKPTWLSGRMFYSIKIWDRKFGIPYLRTLGYSSSPDGGNLAREITSRNGIIWNAWDLLGRQRYIETEPVFYGVGSSIIDNGTAEINYL